MMKIGEMKNKAGEVTGWALWVGGNITLVFETEEEALAAMELLLEQHNHELQEEMAEGRIMAWAMADFFEELRQKLELRHQPATDQGMKM